MGIKACVFFDWVDFEDDKEDFLSAAELAAKAFLVDKLFDTLCITDKVEEFRDKAPYADVCFIDFGGLDMQGATGFLDASIRVFENLIEEYENKLFVFMLSIPVDCYIKEDILKKPNVRILKRYNLLSELGKIYEELNTKEILND